MTTQQLTEIPRDRWGRPLIIPPGGGEPVGYTRASTLGKALDDQTNLMSWKARKTAEGLLRRPDLMTRLSGALANGDPDTDWPTKRAVNDVCRDAMEAAGASKGASAGTGFHSLTEALDRGEDPLFVSDADQVRLDAYRIATADYEPLDAECFIVNDAVQAAGTFDRLYRCPDGRVRVADLKGLDLATPIPTPTGWTTMREVRVGDEVFDAHGKPCQVTAKSQVKRIGTFIVSFDTGDEVVCDSEHLWWTAAKRDPFPQVRAITEIRDTLTDARGQRQHRVPVAGSLELGASDLPVPPYLLGCWLGDGHARGGVISKQADLFKVLTDDGIALGEDQELHRENVSTHTVLGLTKHLRALGLLHNKHIPMAYLRGNQSQRLLLLQGLMDTDGTWNVKRRRAVFSSTSRVLAEQVAELVLTLGERAIVQSFTANGFGKTVTAYGVEFTPRNLNPFRLPRKAARVDLAGKRLAVAGRRLITSVMPGPDVETACIAVDGADSTYLCGRGFIPTHNTGKSESDYPGATAVQIAVYANGSRYDPTTGERTPLHPDLDLTTGLLVHLPASGGCEVISLDLEAGWRAAHLAVAVRELRTYKAADWKRVTA